MKKIIVVIIILAAGIGGYQYYQKYQKEKIERQTAHEILTITYDISKYIDARRFADAENLLPKLLIYNSEIWAYQKELLRLSHLKYLIEKQTLEITSTVRESNHVYVRGNIKNNGTKALDYYEIVCDFLDNDGNIVDSDYTNNNVLLKPGASQRFEISTSYHSSIKRVSCRVEKVSF